MKVLSIHWGKCSGCSIIIDNEIKFAVSEERFSRIKSDESYPKRSIEEALRFCKINPDELDQVLIAANRVPFIPPLLRVYSKFSLKDHLRLMKEYWHPKLLQNDPVKMIDLFRDRIDTDRYPFDQPFVKDLDFEKIEQIQFNSDDDEKISNFFKEAISKQIGIGKEKIIHVEHDTCHGSYGFYGSPIRDKNTLILTADAWGDNTSGTISVYDSESGQIKRVKEYDHRQFQLARIYRYTTLLLRMIPNEHEYKVMGLAPYYNGKMVQEVENVYNKMLKINNLEFEFNSEIKDIYHYLKENLSEFRFDHIAAGVQSFSEKILVEWFTNALKEYNSDSIVFSGGVSLNIKANLMISRIDNLKKFFVCGGGGDETLHIGACYHYAAQQKIQPKPLDSLYLGTDADYTDDEIKIFDGYDVNEFKNVDQILNLILENKILATCRGRAEMGPRSLGNRSILADPRKTSNIQKINTAIKNRDFWMPFSPIILHDYQDELIKNPKKLESPHMTIAFDTIDGENKIPAAIHQADKTARPQLLMKEVNPELWELIKKFYEETGIPSLLNTSFNLHGEPIVNNINDALHVFENSKLDALWLNRHIIQK
jgi:carbamoyltransferase